MRVSSIEVTEDLKSLWKETAKLLKGSERRQYMAKVVRQLGYGGKSGRKENWAGIGERSEKANEKWQADSRAETHSSDEVANQWRRRCRNCESESEQSSSRRRKPTRVCKAVGCTHESARPECDGSSSSATTMEKKSCRAASGSVGVSTRWAIG